MTESIRPPADWFQNGFHRFLVPYLRRHFHAIGLRHGDRQKIESLGPGSLIVFGNHPSWWDPLLAQFINRVLLAPRQFYAPIDAAALESYRVFNKLGFFGVRLSSTSGAAAFLKSSRAILSDPATALWLTPEGRFCDARDTKAPLMPGLAHLCSRGDARYALPFAFEYVFWDERLPVALAVLGSPIEIAAEPAGDKSDWNRRLNSSLRSAQAELAELAIARDDRPFENLLSGKKGVGGVYGSLRRARAWLGGASKVQHGEQFQ